MVYQQNKFLIGAAILNFIGAALHVLIILGGPDWYRFFGAGEEMAQMAENGDITATLLTLVIIVVLSIWGLYALSGALMIRRLPLLKTALVVIIGIYCIRGIYGFFLPYISDHPSIQNLGLSFWLWSSSICLSIGVIHLIGVKKTWQYL